MNTIKRIMTNAMLGITLLGMAPVIAVDPKTSEKQAENQNQPSRSVRAGAAVSGCIGGLVSLGLDIISYTASTFAGFTGGFVSGSTITIGGTAFAGFNLLGWLRGQYLDKYIIDVYKNGVKDDFGAVEMDFKGESLTPAQRTKLEEMLNNIGDYVLCGSWLRKELNTCINKYYSTKTHGDIYNMIYKTYLNNWKSRATAYKVFQNITTLYKAVEYYIEISCKLKKDEANISKKQGKA